MKYKVILLLVLTALMTTLVPAWTQQEIELKLETPPAVAPTEQPETPVPPEPENLPSKIEAIMRGKAPALTGASAILVDSETGQVLYEKNSFVRRPIASTTKIMTAIVALERGNLDDNVVVSKNAASIPHTSLNLRAGERIPLRDMLTGMLIRSANDAAVAVAEHIAGSVPAFAKLMNDKAKEIGAKNTSFKNPNGLYVPGHYSTAYDLALITRYALQIPEFNEMVRSKKATLARSINLQDVVVFNKSQFIKNYPGADGVKSGYTHEAGNCYVGSATRDDWRLVSVILKSKNATKDTAALMDYGFNNFRRVVLVPKGKVYRSGSVIGAGKVPAVTAYNLGVALPGGNNTEDIKVKANFQAVKLPIRRGQVIGDLSAYLDGRVVASIPLTATRDIEKSVAGTAAFWLRSGLLLLVCAGIGVRYAGATAKAARRGRNRIAAQIRRSDLFR